MAGRLRSSSAENDYETLGLYFHIFGTFRALKRQSCLTIAIGKVIHFFWKTLANGLISVSAEII
jgi:hypothetical protein